MIVVVIAETYDSAADSCLWKLPRRPLSNLLPKPLLCMSVLGKGQGKKQHFTKHHPVQNRSRKSTREIVEPSVMYLWEIHICQWKLPNSQGSYTGFQIIGFS